MNRISRVVGSLLLAASGGHIHAFAPRATWNPKPSVTSKSKSAPTPTLLFSSSNEPPTFYNDFEGFDDDDDDEGYIDTNQLGDWRAFRKSLGGETQVWAHATATPEVGGFLARMPLEVEIYRNHKHSIMGKKLRRQYKDVGEASMFWYRNAKQLVEEEMQKIAETAQDGQLDSSELDDESSEMLQLYLDNQVSSVTRRALETERCNNIFSTFSSHRTPGKKFVSSPLETNHPERARPLS
jgi:hypothetical protein